MSLSEIDRLWFEAHPDRTHRLVEHPSATPDVENEDGVWPLTRFVIVRRSDGARVRFSAEDGPPATLSDEMTAYWFEHYRNAQS